MSVGLVTAFRTLTVLPIPGPEAPQPASALPYFPIVGGVLGLLLWLVGLTNCLIAGGGWPAGVAAFMVLADAALTRAIHLDGLADCVDALGGGWDRQRRLEIMKDSQLGVFGVVALMLVLLCKWLAFSRLVAGGSTSWVVLIFVISRTMQVDLMVRLPYARSEAGTASLFVTGAKTWHRYAALSISLALGIGFYGLLSLGALAVARGLTWWFGSLCHRRLGGVTGDLLGADNELVETTLLMLVAASDPWIVTHTGWSWLVS